MVYRRIVTTPIGKKKKPGAVIICFQINHLEYLKTECWIIGLDNSRQCSIIIGFRRTQFLFFRSISYGNHFVYRCGEVGRSWNK